MEGNIRVVTDSIDDSGALARVGVSQATTAPWTLDEDLRAYQAAGCSALGLWLHKLERGTMAEFWFPELILDEKVVDAAAEAIDAAGLGVSHVIMAGRFTEPDEEVRRRRIAHALSAVGVARRLGARCLVVIPGRLNGLTAARATDLAAASLAEILDSSGDVPIALEPVQEVDFTNTLDEALDLVELVDHPLLGVYPDVFHLWRDPGLQDAMVRATGRILGVHLADGTGANGDRTRLPPGEGVLPLAEFVTAVEATGYSGTYDLELFSMGMAPAEAKGLLDRALNGMRNLVPEPGSG